MFEYSKNKLTIASVMLFALVITVLCIYLNSTHYILGHSYRDVFFYLIESLRFSGVEIGGYKYVNYLPPFIPFLTSLLFRMGFISHVSIFIVSGVFFFFGIFGFFKLLNLKFNNFYSFFGAFVYATLSINLKWVGNGTLDIPFVAFMIWALYFFILGVDKNQKYFYLAFPLAVLSFFTKYTGAIIFGVMLLYFICNFNTSYFKHLSGGVISGILTSLPFFAYYFIYDVPLGFLNQANEISSTSSLTATSGGKLIGNDLFFYIKGLIYDISSTDYIIGIIILAIAFLGILYMIYSFKDKFNLLSVAGIVTVLVSFLTAGLFSFVFSEIILFCGLIIIYHAFLKKISPYTVSMFALFLFFFVFFSAHLTKADRYFTSMAPGFVFILTLSYEFLSFKIKKSKLIPVFVMFLMVIVAGSYFCHVMDDSLAVDESKASVWLADKEGVIYSDRGPAYTWYLQREVGYIQLADDIDLQLLSHDADYFVSVDESDLTHFVKIKNFGDVYIYQRI